MLRGALASLSSDFNSRAGTTRIVVLVSPTCPGCLEGVGLVAGALRRHPDAEVAVLVLWVLALEGDSPGAARTALHPFHADPRVTHYWEERDGWTLASAFRSVIGFGPRDDREIAWDIYVLYGPEGQWSSEPPAATDWLHNIRDVPPALESRRVDAVALDSWLGPTVLRSSPASTHPAHHTASIMHPRPDNGSGTRS